jgi:NAD-dependent deacetylase
MRDVDSAVTRVAGLLTPTARITVLTGAGVSAASGVPTFRGSGGLWKSFRAEDLATPQAFARDPATVWEWYDWRRGLIAGCAPNAAHHVLASWSLRFPQFTLVTQNVDGLHERAGTQHVVRLHGSIWDVGCWRDCGRLPRRWRDDRVPLTPLPPVCDRCGGPLRPGVVWFGESLDTADIEAANDAARCDVFLAIGTSAIVYPAAGLIGAAKAHGATTVEINPDATAASAAVDVALASGAETMLPAIDARLGAHPRTLETERLILRPLLPADAEPAHALWTDPDVRRYLWDDVAIGRQTTDAVLQASAHDFGTRRFGLWGLYERVAPASLIGFCGLRIGDDGEGPELLFGLLPTHWHRGLAVEAGRAVIGYARRLIRDRPLAAAADAPNTASQATLARLGFVLERRTQQDGRDTLFYRLPIDADGGIS